MNKNQRGFSTIEALLIIVVLGLIGFAGWFMWQKNNDNKTSDKQTKSSQKESPKETKKTFTVPEGYMTYTNEEFGFSFAYPQEWGKLSPPSDSNFGYSLMSKYIGDEPLGTSRLQGWFGIDMAKTDSFTLSTGKYGASVAPTKVDGKYIWKVTRVNPANTTDKVGDTYPIKTTTGASGTTIYDSSSVDEGAHHSTWAFEAKGMFITVDLPAILHGEMDAVPAENLSKYNAIAKNIQDSVVVK